MQPRGVGQRKVADAFAVDVHHRWWLEPLELSLAPFLISICEERHGSGDLGKDDDDRHKHPDDNECLEPVG